MVKNVVSTFNKGDREYKLFEVNDVARYGMHVDNHLLDPIQMKALLYLLWKCNLKTPGSFVSITLPVEELPETKIAIFHGVLNLYTEN